MPSVMFPITPGLPPRNDPHVYVGFDVQLRPWVLSWKTDLTLAEGNITIGGWVAVGWHNGYPELRGLYGGHAEMIVGHISAPTITPELQAIFTSHEDGGHKTELKAADAEDVKG